MCPGTGQRIFLGGAAFLLSTCGRKFGMLAPFRFPRVMLPGAAITSFFRELMPTMSLSVAPESCAVRIAFVRPGAEALYAGALEPATRLSAGLDLRACLETEEVRIAPGERVCVPSGISVQPCLPHLAGFLYSRSGLGARDGLTVAQGVGVIDPDYTGEVLVMLLNTSGAERILRRGERMAQLIFQPFVRPRWEIVPQLEATERGSGGFGHTGR